MSATELLVSSVPELGDPVLQSDATTVNAICALLECRDILTAKHTAQAIEEAHSDQFDKIIRRKLRQIDGPRAVQDFAHLVNTHLADLEFAKKRADANGFSGFAVEQLFLQIQSHPSNGDLDGYLDSYSIQLWNALMPSHLPDTLIHAILTPILKSACRLMSTPWVIHSLIIALNDFPLDQEKPKFRVRDLLKRNGPNDYNPFVRDLLYRLGGRSFIFKILKVTWSPLNSVIAMLINRIITNIFSLMFPMKVPVDDKNIRDYIYTIRDLLLLQDHHDPGLEEQQRLRKKAMNLVPKVIGTPVLADYTFDYYLVNQRLIVSCFDFVLELVKYN